MSDVADVLAEGQVLGMTMLAPKVARDRFLALGIEAWSSEVNRLIAAVITDMYRRGAPVGVQAVQHEVAKRTGVDDAARRASMHVLELHEQSAPISSLRYYVDRVHRIAQARTVSLAAAGFVQRVEHAMTIDDDDSYGRAITDLTVALGDAARPVDAAEPPMSLADLLNTDIEHDWLIPNLMERTDRLILTGFEGLGKSELICQIAVASAAGLHPFTGNPFPSSTAPFRVLVVDAENGRRQVARRYGRVQGMVDKLRADCGLDPVDWRQALRLVIRPEGISLSSPHEVARLEQAIVATGPALVVAGPLYKMADQDTRDEQVAKELTVALDRIRQRYQVALVLEAHSGHGGNFGPRNVRPTGSSVFLRWPEFGYGLRPAEHCADQDAPAEVVVQPWRGAREERAFPRALSRGNRLPWVPSSSTYFDHMELT